MTDFDRLATVVNEQKGNIVAVQALLMGVLRAMPHDERSVARREFELECEAARVVLLNSSAPEDVLHAFDAQVAAITNLWLISPRNT